MAEFHVIVRGACWLRMKGRASPIALHGGDLLVFPHGDAHSLLDAPDGAALPAEDILEGQNLDHYGPVTHGGAGLPATVLCGYFRCDRSNLPPLVTARPPLIHLRGTESHDFAWLQTTLNFMIHETRVANPGADAVVGRLAEVLFVQMTRAYFAQSGSPPGMLAGIGDARIGAALQLMHRSPEFAWTLASLARRAGMSRSAFATRFNRLVDQTPMHYLTAWRMHRARELLKDTPAWTGRNRRDGRLSVRVRVQQGVQGNRRTRARCLSPGCGYCPGFRSLVPVYPADSPVDPGGRNEQCTQRRRQPGIRTRVTASSGGLRDPHCKKVRRAPHPAGVGE